MEESGARRLKTKEDGAMGSQILHSDSQFLKETVDAMGKTEEPTVLITDGAYSGRDNAGYHFQKTNVKTVRTVTSATPRCLTGPVWFFYLKNPLTEQRRKGK